MKKYMQKKISWQYLLLVLIVSLLGTGCSNKVAQTVLVPTEGPMVETPPKDPIRMEFTYNQLDPKGGVMKAFFPDDEVCTGEYRVIQDSHIIVTGGQVGTVTATTYYGQAVLTSEKGRVLQVEFTAKSYNFAPRGFGSAKDNLGNAYRFNI